MLHVIAIDVGASNGRVMAGSFDGSRLAVREAGRFPNTPVGLAGGFYWNILSLYDSIKSILRQLNQQGQEVASLAFDTWAQDFGLIGSRSLLANPRHYRDPYTEGQVAAASQKMSPREMFDVIATRPFQGATFYQLLAMKEKQPRLLACADHLLFMPNLLTYLASGIISCDCTLASFSQMYDIFRKDWSGEIRSRFDLPDILPPVQLPGQVIGQTDYDFAADTGYSGIKVVLAAGHDTASAAFTKLRHGENSLVISCGTWSMLVAGSDQPVVSYRDTDLSFSNALGADGRYILVRGITGLWMLQQCKREWQAAGTDVGYAELERYAFEHDCPAWFDVDDPRLAQMQSMSQAIAQLCLQNGFAAPRSPHEYYTVIMHSLARKYQQAFAEYESVTGRVYNPVHIIGGGAKDPVLRELTARYSHKDVVAGPAEATAIGNILLQLIALGEISEDQVPDLVATLQE